MIEAERNRCLDLLMLHVPKWNNFYNPFGYFTMNNVISYGTFSIADWVDQNGYRVEIAHMGAEILFDKGFRLGRFLREKSPLLIGICCHWHYQVFDVGELAKHIKRLSPETKIVIGGYTASIFTEELMARYPDVDYVIRGEAEVPMVALLRALNNVSRLDGLPNLSFRLRDNVVHNPITFVADKEFLEGLTFCRMDLFPRYETYLKYLSYPVYLRSYPKFFNYKVLTSGRLEGYMVPIGRGCPVNCQYCGGGNKAAETYFGRKHTTLLSPRRVFEDIVLAKQYGVESLYFPFDPYPESDYYIRLFELIRGSGLTLDATFESFGLPTKPFIDAFAATFGKGKRAQIMISPETGDGALRTQCKGYDYSNVELFDTLDYIEKAGPAVQVSYSLGLPDETQYTLSQTDRLWRQIKKRYKSVFLQTATIIDPDPGSPAESRRQIPKWTLEEVVRRHETSSGQSCTGWTYLPGRHVCRNLEDSVTATYGKLSRLKCRQFCSYMYYPHKIVFPINRMCCILLGVIFRLICRPFDIKKYL